MPCTHQFRPIVDYDFSFSNGALAVKTMWSANLVFNIFIVSCFSLTAPLIFDEPFANQQA